AISLALAGSALTIAGCGSGGSSGPLTVNQLPLIQGASVVTQTRLCDGGSNAFCALEAVIADPHASSSGALTRSEHRQLHSLGWTTSAGDDGNEVAADSPGHKLRVTFATGLNDLIGIDEGWIKRPQAIGLSLSQLEIHGTPAMSIMLEEGPT
ncbi:MAG: hypothetical protein JO244_04095, partial [Solirubrobacterales bacterium]|nr:hypothetical protein [Solirubrobacterales bacterium]